MKLNDVIKYNKLVWERLYTVKVAQSCPTLCDSVDCKSMEFSRPEYWSGEPFPSPGDLPNPRIEPRSPALRTDALTSVVRAELQRRQSAKELMPLNCGAGEDS